MSFTGSKNIFKDAKFFMVLDGEEIPIELSELLIDHPAYSRVPSIELKGFIEGASARKPINKVIFNDPATIVFWNDGTKTVVKCQKGDTFSKELGLAMAISKKFFGNKGNYNDVFNKYIKEEE